MSIETQRRLHPDRERHHLNLHRNSLRKEVSDISCMAFRTVDESPKEVRAKLAQIWIDFGVTDRSLICATWINTWTEETIEPVAQEEDCLVAIGLYDDFFSGMSFINDTIDIAKKEIDGNSDSTFSETYESEKLERSLGDRLREREYAQKCADRLGKDQTGFLMMDKFYRELLSGRWRDGFETMDKSVVFRGAGLARGLYKAVYPLSAGLGKTSI